MPSVALADVSGLLHDSFVVNEVRKRGNYTTFVSLVVLTRRTSCAGSRHNMPPSPVTLTLKVVSESRVTWATSVPILVFLGLSILDLGPMYATDRQTSDSIASSLNALSTRVGHNNKWSVLLHIRWHQAMTHTHLTRHFNRQR